MVDEEGEDGDQVAAHHEDHDPEEEGRDHTGHHRTGHQDTAHPRIDLMVDTAGFLSQNLRNKILIKVNKVRI